MNSDKSTRHNPVRTRRADRNETSELECLDDVKMPSKTWDYVVSHTEAHRAKEAIQTQVITIPPPPGRVKNKFPWTSPTRPCGKGA